MKIIFFVVFSLFTLTATATNFDLVCWPIFRQANAIPNTPECVANCNMALVGMGTYYCLGSGGYVAKYCKGLCQVDVLMPITDVDAQNFENGHTINTDQLTTETQSALSCLKNKVISLGGTLTVTSAWRPQTYQNHIREIFDKWRDLKKIREDYPNQFPQCDERFKQLNVEYKRHGLKGRVGQKSNHTSGNAFDATWKGVTTEQIDIAAQGCGLTRPFPADDHVHFQR